ncbi:MAG: bestrophin-like domain [Ktedonobacterales bacterium]
MDAFLYALPAWLLFLLMVGVPAGLAWVGTVQLGRRVKPPADEKHNEVAGFIFATEGVIYAVLLAFVVIVVWEQYLTAENNVSQEAAAVITVARDASSFPEPARAQVYDQLRAYSQLVIKDEWRTMNEGMLEREESRDALARINTVWRIYRSLPPSQVDPHTTESLDTLSAHRATRLQSNVAALPAALWVGLVLGAVVTICFSLVLYMENVRFHAAFTALLTALIATSLWMILVINHPFAGDLRVSPDAFRHAIYVIESLPR